MPPHQITAKQTINEHSENELRKKRAQLFDPIKDFRKYQSTYIYTIFSLIDCCKMKRFTISPSFIRSDSQKPIENGIITQMRAEWILPEDKKLEVTLKELRKDKYLTVST